MEKVNSLVRKIYLTIYYINNLNLQNFLKYGPRLGPQGPVACKLIDYFFFHFFFLMGLLFFKFGVGTIGGKFNNRACGIPRNEPSPLISSLLFFSAAIDRANDLSLALRPKPPPLQLAPVTFLSRSHLPYK
jgi:hypothetical protein